MIVNLCVRVITNYDMPHLLQHFSKKFLSYTPTSQIIYFFDTNSATILSNVHTHSKLGKPGIFNVLIPFLFYDIFLLKSVIIYLLNLIYFLLIVCSIHHKIISPFHHSNMYLS